jgi:hypothetical protein
MASSKLLGEDDVISVTRATDIDISRPEVLDQKARLTHLAPDQLADAGLTTGCGLNLRDAGMFQAAGVQPQSKMRRAQTVVDDRLMRLGLAHRKLRLGLNRGLFHGNLGPVHCSDGRAAPR